MAVLLERPPLAFRSDEFRLLDFQEECLLSVMKNKRHMVNLGVGSGKTLIALSLYHYLYEKNSDYKCVYITEHSVLRQVEENLRKFFTSNVKITTLFKDSLASRVEKYTRFLREDRQVLVISYENLVGAFGKKTTLKNKMLLERERELLVEVFNKLILLVVDEATNIKNPKSLANQILVKLSQNAGRSIAMTGTPVMKSLADIYNIALGVGISVMPKWEFNLEHCVWTKFRIGRKEIRKLSGHKKVSIFWERLKGSYYTYKADMGLGLRMLRYDLELGESERSSMKRLYAEKQGQPAYNECSIAINKGDVKFNWFKELVGERIEGKCVVYSPYLTVVHDFISRLGLGKDEYAEITGDVGDKTAERDRFIDDDGCRYLFITDAGGRGLDGLQRVARHMVFLNLPISSGQMTQVVGRLYRIGSTYSDIVVHVPLVWGSIDEDIYQVVQSEFHLVKSVNPEQLMEGLVDEGVALRMKFDEMGNVDLWLKEKIMSRTF
jgi:hypothetical protein